MTGVSRSSPRPKTQSKGTFFRPWESSFEFSFEHDRSSMKHPDSLVSPMGVPDCNFAFNNGSATKPSEIMSPNCPVVENTLNQQLFDYGVLYLQFMSNNLNSRPLPNQNFESFLSNFETPVNSKLNAALASQSFHSKTNRFNCDPNDRTKLEPSLLRVPGFCENPLSDLIGQPNLFRQNRYPKQNQANLYSESMHTNLKRGWAGVQISAGSGVNNEKKIFSCKICDKTYSSLGALKMHIRTHTLPCKCHICGKAFSRPWLLQGHIRTHTGEKPFVCNQCDRAFADRSNLRAHLQTHEDKKKFACKQKHCGKTFSRASLLDKHCCGANTQNSQDSSSQISPQTNKTQ